MAFVSLFCEIIFLLLSLYFSSLFLAGGLSWLIANWRLARRPGISRMSVVVIIFFVSGIVRGTCTRHCQSAGGSATAHRVNCHLKQIGLAVHGFHDLHSAIVPGTLASAKLTRKSLTVDDGVTWCVLLLPFVESESVWKKFSADNALEWQGIFPKESHKNEIRRTLMRRA